MKYHDVSADEVKKLQQENPEAVLLDVRTPMEVAMGKIPGAYVIDLMSHQFDKEVAQLDKSKTYVVYCRSGGRSAQACNYMSGKGFSNLYNLRGGIGSWPYETE